MPTFDPTARTSRDKDWALLHNSHVHLYWRAQVLDDTVSWLQARQYRIFAFDAGHWVNAADMHSDLARGFDSQAVITIAGQPVTRASGFLAPPQSESGWMIHAAIARDSNCYTIDFVTHAQSTRDKYLSTADRMIGTFRFN